MRIGAALLAALMAVSLHHAQARTEVGVDSPMQTFAGSDTYKALIRRALATVPPTVVERCPTLVADRSRIVVLKPLLFAADGRPMAGAWKQSFPVSGCGNDTVLNLYVFATADEKLKVIVGAPGATHADVRLQLDALTYARIGAGLAVQGTCQAFGVTNTRFEAYGLAQPPTPDPGADDRLRPWWETWTMAGCGRSVDVPIDFVPDATGTRIIQPGGAVAR